MRTTVTLDTDVEQLLEEAVHRERRSFKAVINDAIRRGLSAAATRRARTRYRVVPHETQLRPGVDPAGLNRLADELEDEAIIAKTRRKTRRS